MGIKASIQDWWRRQTLEDDSPLDNDSVSFIVSFVVHLVIVLTLGFIPWSARERNEPVLITSTIPDEIQPELEKTPQEVYFSNQPSDQIGANSVDGDFMALSMAPEVSEVSDLPLPLEVEPSQVANIEINNAVQFATGLHYSENIVVKGAAGVGTTGAVGAVDRITHEILLSLEERKTLVVWLFDQSPSMIRQRSTVNDRFDRIYKELGVLEAAQMEAFKKHDDKPLLTSVVAFGKAVQAMTKTPTDQLAEIKKAVDAIPADESGDEMTFHAVIQAAKEYSKYRTSMHDGQPERNVLIVVFTDEAGSDQTDPQFGVDAAVKVCKRYQMPVYVVGVPAPFGTKETQVKWVDPDPKYDQTPRWGVVDQGPETLFPERLKLSFSGSKDEDDAIDSGFGPYSLTRLCYETGGIYFTVHPNRDVHRAVSRSQVEPFSAHIKHFFDSEVMRRYKPDYVSLDEYTRRLKANKCREALVKAAGLSHTGTLEDPQTRFVKRDEAEFANALSEAQKDAARLEPKLADLYENYLKQGEADRERELSPRWQAGFDLAAGRVLAARVRTEGYNAMLAAAKRGLKFKNEKNNTWILEPSDEISIGSQYQKMADKAKMYLERVVNDHPNTPWSLLASKELKQPLGWKWKEEFTNLAPPPKDMPGNNNNAPAPADDKKMMLNRPPVRPVPKKL
jgi:hypothetical protein